MTLAAGRRLGHYEIVAPLGAGGMGEVYKARDTRLDRLLAVKVLPHQLSADAERIRRFALEARAASALNHPAILAVYDVGTEDSVSYIAMEYVDGPTLLELLRLGPLPIKRQLDIAVMVADGLASAHEAGIVHRDIKPANLMVAREGYVKILDFGLAKLTMPRERAGPRSDSTTESTPGTIVGTVRYMSPEQARGAPVDFRSDQFSFGSVVYEMATGQPAFQGETDVDTMAAILRQEPTAIGPLNPSVPAPLRWIIERCHAKSPADRYSSTRDLARELRSLRDHLTEISTLPTQEAQAERRGKRVLPWIALGLLANAGAFAWLWSRPPSHPPPPDFRRLTLRQGAVYRALFSPRSNSILYTASWEGQPVRSYLTLPESKGADRSLEAETHLPMAYSEDGSEVLVLLGRSRPAINAFGSLAWWPALGGKPRPVVDHAGWADWAPRARVLVAVREEGSERMLDVLDAHGGPVRTLFRTVGAVSYVRVSPDEQTVAFIHHPSRSDDAGEVRVVSLDGSRSRAVSDRFERCAGLDWNEETGEIWFTATRENIYRTTLWATTPSGRSRPVYSMPDFFVLNDLSGRDSLFVSSTGGTNLMLRDAAGTRDYTWLGYTLVEDVSPDGKSILFLDGGATEQSLGTWVRPLNGGDAVRVSDGDPGRFSPDGGWVVTASRVASGLPQLALVPTAGGTARQLTAAQAAHSDASFAGPDWLLYVRTAGDRREVWRMRVSGGGEAPTGVTDCNGPTADPTGRQFLCRGGTQDNALLVHPLEGGTGRTLHVLPAGDSFRYARWDRSGRRIFAVTRSWRLLTIDAGSGARQRDEEILPLPGLAQETLRTAALNADATIQAYSISHFTSRLYLCRGL